MRCEPIRTPNKKTRPLFILSGLVFFGKGAVSRSWQLEIYEVNIQK